MKIYDIPQATQITINMVHNNEMVSTRATVLTRYGDGILITPIEGKDGKIDYCGNNANFEFVERFSGIKHTFRADMISRVDFAGSDFHVINGSEIIVHKEQRRAERYSVELMGSALINEKECLSVVINDISMRGFSLLIGKKIAVNVGDTVKVNFTRTDKAVRLTMTGVVVRNFTVSGMEAIGCEFDSVSPLLLGFIMDKKASRT